MKLNQKWSERLEWLQVLAAGFGPFIVVSAVFGIPNDGEHSKYWSAVGILSFIALFGGFWWAQKIEARQRERRSDTEKHVVKEWVSSGESAMTKLYLEGRSASESNHPPQQEERLSVELPLTADAIRKGFVKIELGGPAEYIRQMIREEKPSLITPRDKGSQGNLSESEGPEPLPLPDMDNQ